MRIVFFGSADFGLPCLEAIKSSGNELAGIFTQPAQRAGRGRKLAPTAVAVWARQNSVRCTEAADINSPQIFEKIADCHADLLVVIAFGQKIGQKVIDLHPKGAINVHTSLLPKYRGAAPINRALLNNESHTGISIITLADRMDAGDILAQLQIPIDPDDTAGSLSDKLARSAGATLLRTIQQIADGTAVYSPQDESLVSCAPKLKKSDGFIDWSAPAETIRNKIRALSPWPGAQTDYNPAEPSKACRVTIVKAAIVSTTAENDPPFGRLDGQLNVICGHNSLKILQIKPAGSNLMDFKAFVNGRNTKPGDSFVTISAVE